ncbi:ankyrin repeat-containing domain protein [Aspergillus novoparasiticus]|uniref:Ankyrin repeat-containing domain protein n=1 Tax=Aspergillus novoparasiticus TaxID=986946 RepID=A0A5N6F579_9EURO|nr:ankyrin repeat-containing domain protein [Aspergillus novoparasiticus]
MLTLLYTIGPKTPEGVIVGTPRSAIDDIPPEIPLELLEMDWPHDLIEAGSLITDEDLRFLWQEKLIGNFTASSGFPDASGLLSNADRVALASPIEIPQLSPSAFLVLDDREPAAASSNQVGQSLNHQLQSVPAIARMSTNGGEPIDCNYDSLSNEIIRQARVTLAHRYPRTDDKYLTECLSFLEPITIGHVNQDLTRKAENIFQSRSSDMLSHYISLCVYLSSNNMLSTWSMDGLIALIVKSKSQPRLKALLYSKTTTIEIFMSNLLASAAAMGEIEIYRIRILLDAGATVNTDLSRIEGITPLQEATKIRDPSIRGEIIHLLLRAGADIQPQKGQEKYASLHTAVSQGDLLMTKALLRKGASPNVGYCARTNRTPLQQASSLGDESLFQVLLDYGANINAPPHWDGGRTALQSSAERNHLSIVRRLLQLGASVKEERALEGISVMEAAVNNCNLELIQLLLDIDPSIICSDPTTKGIVIGNTLSHWKCDVSLLELLLKGGADVNNMDTFLSLPFLQLAARKRNLGFVQCLLTGGAHVNCRGQSSTPGNVTALQEAVASRHIDIVQLLPEWAADVNAPANEKGGKTALQIAVSQHHFELVELLVQNGANVNGLPSPQRGRTALQEAASSGYVQMTQYLLN